jgi:uncharacterized delta-60 repeat protein
MIGRRVTIAATVAIVLGTAGVAVAAPGDLDAGFGDGGVASFGFPQGLSSTDVALQPDGRILLAGSAHNGRTGVGRLLSDGTLDPSFHRDGTLSHADGGFRERSVAIRPDGRILIASLSLGDRGVRMLGLLPQGVVDPSFGDRGQRLVRVRHAFTVADIALGADGTAVIVGSTDSHRGWFVVRITPEGRPDPAFGGDGIVRVVPGNGRELTAVARSVAVLADGRIVVGGTARAGLTRFAVLRLLADGTPDPSFDGDGLALGTLPDGDRAFGEDMVVAPDGAVVIAGSRDTVTPPGRTLLLFDPDVALASFRADGSPDPAFDGDGLQVIDVGESYSRGFAIGRDGAGRLVVAGDADLRQLVIRISAGGALDASFGDGGVAILDGFGYPATAVVVESDDDLILTGHADPTRYPGYVAERILGS